MRLQEEEEEEEEEEGCCFVSTNIVFFHLTLELKIWILFHPPNNFRSIVCHDIKYCLSMKYLGSLYETSSFERIRFLR